MDHAGVIIVDGNNVMGSRPDGWWRDRSGAARRLTAEVAALATAEGGAWTIVFDGRPPDDAAAPAGVTVEYAARPGRDAADGRIIELLAALPTGTGALLYTSDRGLRDRAVAAGANVQGAGALLRRLDAAGRAAPPGLSVRPATPEDVPTLMDFILGMAEYEGVLHKVTATPEGMHASLFGETPRIEAIIGLVDGQAAGFATYYNTFSTFISRPGLYLEDIYVTAEHRRCGLGTLLLRRLARVAVERGCARFEWSALTWNTNAHAFYYRLGAEMQEEWRSFRLSGDALQRLADEEQA